MAITNTSKPSAPSFSNLAKVIPYETWDTNTSTWDTETRTWDGMQSEMTNTARAIQGDNLWSASTLPWQLSSPWTYVAQGLITNTPRP